MIRIPWKTFIVFATTLLCTVNSNAQQSKTINISNREVQANLLYSDSFDNDLSNWIIETDFSAGSVAIENNKLNVNVETGCVLWFKEWLKGPIMIEFDATPIDQGGDLDNVSDLNSFILAHDLNADKSEFFDESNERGSSGSHLSLYDPYAMYYVGQGGGKNSRTRFRRYDGQGERPLLDEHDLTGQFLLQGNETHHIQIIVYRDTFQYYSDGELVYNWVDPNFPAYSEGYYGFRTINTHWNLDNYQFYSLEDYCNNTADLITAECFDNLSGIQTENSVEGGKNIGWINDGDWVMYKDIDLTERSSVEARVATKSQGGTIEIRLDSPSGQIISSLEVESTGNNQSWTTISQEIDTVSGVHDIYLVFKGEEGYLFNLNWIKFSKEELLIEKEEITVSTLQEFISHLDKDHQHLKLEKGTYIITADDMTNNVYDIPVFNITGNHNIIDFSESTIQFETDAFEAVYVDFTEFNVIGNNNVIQNLIVEDLGNTKPYKTALGFNLDGSDNKLDNIDMTIRGSYPYGYGDLFGKGSGYVIKHYKHSAIRVTGYRNRVSNCNILHRAYGHGIFIQGGIDIVVENCHLEGEMRSTDDVLAEQGTGTPADEVNFMTVWGHTVPIGWMFSCQEDAIRSYNTGTHFNGESYNTENTIIKNCTVKNFRDAYTIGFTDGEKYVENCTAIGCEQAFWLGKGGDIVNCYADSQYGPIYSAYYSHDKDTKGDITVLDSGPAYGNHKALAYFGGNNHNITFKNNITQPDENLFIFIGGERNTLRGLDSFSSDESTITNHTPYPIVINGDNHNITTCSTVSDMGSGNSIELLENCKIYLPSHCNNTADLIEAECFNDFVGIQTEESSEGGENVGWINHNEWVMYENIDLTERISIDARVASKIVGNSIEVRLDSTNGELISTLEVPDTGGIQSWQTINEPIETTSGIHDIYLVFKGGDGYLFNLNWVAFLEEATLSITNHDLSKDQIKIYPNPTSEIITIHGKQNSTLKVYDSNGREVLNSTIMSNKENIDLSKLSKGSYYIHINKSGKNSITKIIRE